MTIDDAIFSYDTESPEYERKRLEEAALEDRGRLHLPVRILLDGNGRNLDRAVLDEIAGRGEELDLHIVAVIHATEELARRDAEGQE